MAETTISGKLTGKTAVVTGASSGIGQAIAKRFAQEGASVFLAADKNVEGGESAAAEIRNNGGTATFVQCDVAQHEQVQALIEQAVQETGRLDSIVNNAGVGGGGIRAEDVSIEDFHRTVNVNLAGAFYGAKYAIPHLRHVGGGSIINVSSVYGIIAAPNTAAYCASKGGLIMLTKQLAVDYARENIRVNCICPGFVDTDLGGRRARMTADEADRAHAAREAKAAIQPIGRQAHPDEMSGAALYLASDDASFAAGSILVVDGGESILHNVGQYF